MRPSYPETWRKLLRILKRYVVPHKWNACLEELTAWALYSFDTEGKEIPDKPFDR